MYPLSKCYDKTAKVKLSVDCIPINHKNDIKIQENKYQNQIKFKR